MEQPNNEDIRRNSEAELSLNSRIQEEDEENWQDAEEQHTINEEVPVEKKEPEINESELRKKIKEIQLNSNLTPREKAKQIQSLMSQGITNKRDLNKDTVESAYKKCYFNEEEGILGCQHYQRKCKLQANCCQKIVSCRFCHDEAEDHAIVRNETKNMLCMLCSTLQPAAKNCNNCKEEMARYYCDKCKLWDNHPEKSIYHCDDCGICRQGKGLGEDYFHCKTCNICLSTTMKNHKCIERNLECDCPICGEYMFTSTSTVIFMPCGHCIHKDCYAAYIQTSYQCPTCLKSLGDMSAYFERLDRDLQRQPMPAEYEKFISHIFCNDCEEKSPAKYHFFYHKCSKCGSYNTTVLKTENTEETAQNQSSDALASTTSSQAPIPPPVVPQSSADDINLVSANTDQDYMMQSQMEYRRNPFTGPSSSSSSSRNRNGTESNDG